MVLTGFKMKIDLHNVDSITETLTESKWAIFIDIDNCRNVKKKNNLPADFQLSTYLSK